MSIELVFPEGKMKCLTFSYDDGRDYDEKLIGIFNKYDLKATFHLVSSWLDNEGYMKKSKVKELYQGHEVACHCLTHPYLTELPKSRFIQEILEDRKNLESLVGYPVRGMSYPFGVYSEEICNDLQSLGIEYSRTVNATHMFNIPADYIRWNPTCHHSEVNDQMIDSFLNPPEYVKLEVFYIWGHSFELPQNNGWDHMEDICKKLAHHKDVWYATNIQIKDYLEAGKNLKCTLDQKVIYNPSALTIWFKADGKLLSVKPGETVNI